MWILFTFLAAFMQAWRNAFQSKLSKEVSVAGVTLARFIWAGPIAACYLYGLHQFQPTALPEFSCAFLGFVIGAASMQILATGLMVKLFRVMPACLPVFTMLVVIARVFYIMIQLLIECGI